MVEYKHYYCMANKPAEKNMLLVIFFPGPQLKYVCVSFQLNPILPFFCDIRLQLAQAKSLKLASTQPCCYDSGLMTQTWKKEKFFSQLNILYSNSQQLHFHFDIYIVSTDFGMTYLQIVLWLNDPTPGNFNFASACPTSHCVTPNLILLCLKLFVML